MLCASRWERIRSCPFAGTATWRLPSTTSCFSTKTSLDRALKASWSPLRGSSSTSEHDAANSSKRPFCQHWNCTLCTRAFHSRRQKNIFDPVDIFHGYRNPDNFISFSSSATTCLSPSSIEQHPTKPSLPPKSTTSPLGRPASQYKPAVARAPARGEAASRNILQARLQMKEMKEQLEREQERRKAELHAREIARQKEAEEAAKRVEQAKIDAAEALERQRVQQAEALMRQHALQAEALERERQREEARLVAAEKAEQQRLKREEQARKRARLAEIERQQAPNLVENLQSQWPGLGPEGKDAMARDLLLHPTAISILEKRQDTPIYQELCAIWKTQQQQRAETAWLKRVEEDLGQNKRLLSGELVNLLERQTLVSEADRKTDKAQRMDGYKKLLASFRQLAQLEMATTRALREVLRSLTYTARLQKKRQREAKLSQDSTGTNDVDLDRTAPIDQVLRDQQNLQKSDDLNRFTCLQMSRVFIDFMQESRLLALSTHNMRKLIAFRRFNVAAEGLLDLPQFKLHHALREAEEAWFRSHSALQRAVGFTPANGLGPLQYTGSLTNEARELLGVTPADRLSATVEDRAIIVSDQDPRTRNSPEGKAALSRLNESFAAWRSIQRQRKAVASDQRMLRIAGLRRLLAEGSLAQQKYFQMTFIINNSRAVLSQPLRRILDDRSTERDFITVIRLIHRILAFSDLVVDPECREAFAPALAECHRLQASLEKLRHLYAYDSIASTIEEGAEEAAGQLRATIGRSHREFTALLYDWTDLVSTRSFNMEKEGSLTPEAAELRQSIVHLIEELEANLAVEPGDRVGRQRRWSQSMSRSQAEKPSQQRMSPVAGRRRRTTRKPDTSQWRWGTASDQPQVQPHARKTPMPSRSHDRTGLGFRREITRRGSDIKRWSPALRSRRIRAAKMSVPRSKATTPTDDPAGADAPETTDLDNVHVMSEDDFVKQLSRPERTAQRPVASEANSTSIPSETQELGSRKRKSGRNRSRRRRKLLHEGSHKSPETAALNEPKDDDRLRSNETLGNVNFRPTPPLRQNYPTVNGDVQLEEHYGSQCPSETTSAISCSWTPRFVLSSEAIQQAQSTYAEQDIPWQYDLYRTSDGSRPILHYCKSKAKAEATAQLFLDESILGFDLEWAPNASKNSKIQDSVSLIQLASEERVALFQIALHDGTTASELLAPTLKAIIESPGITKAGVAVRADCTRLEKWLNVKARGVFELSHLYKLVKFGNTMHGLVNKQLVGLSAQVQDIFGMPMRKDEVRRSLWNQSLNHAQCVYAATDAYAGYQLYRELDRRRLAMRPTPPRPAFAEEHRPIELATRPNPPLRTNSEAMQPSLHVDSSELSDLTSDDGESDADALEQGGQPLQHEQASQTAGYSTPLSVAPSGATASLDEATEAKSGHSAGFSKDDDGGLRDTREGTASHMSPAMLTDMEKWFTDRSWRNRRAQVHLGDEAGADLKPMLASPSQQRAYYMWHVLGMSLDEISQAQPKPIKPTTVATYIADTVRLDGAPYDKARLKKVLSALSFGQRWRFRRIEEALD